MAKKELIETYQTSPNLNSTHNQYIEVASCTIDELFANNIPNENIHGKLNIPEYQRAYLWGEEEVKKLLDDLNEYFDHDKEGEKPYYYLGSIILHMNKGLLNIIDGQQRITTLALIQLIKESQERLGLLFSSPKSIANIVENYNLLEEHSSQLQKIDLKQLNVTLIVTTNEDDAYTFFETQNTGGVRLSGVDIIKAHHLRAIDTKEKQSHFASIWEQQKSLKTVTSHLLKARYWNLLSWKEVPLHKNTPDIKKTIINEFSNPSVNDLDGSAFQLTEFKLDENGFKIQIPNNIFHIRQPLNDGINFIQYLESFAKLYYRLFMKKEDPTIQKEFYKFRDNIINQKDGTAYLKEFLEIALLCYAHRFGFSHIVEAAYWLFRYTYSPRLINRRTVREKTIPAFIRDNGGILDHILTSFTHRQLMNLLRKYTYTINLDNLSSSDHGVKKRFVNRIAKYFTGSEVYEGNPENFDDKLKDWIDDRTKK